MLTEGARSLVDDGMCSPFAMLMLTNSSNALTFSPAWPSDIILLTQGAPQDPHITTHTFTQPQRILARVISVEERGKEVANVLKKGGKRM